MKVAVLSANLGNFDTPYEPVIQDVYNAHVCYHTFTDADFPPIAGLTPRLQYRIPKLFGWEMMPGYDMYMWLDGSSGFSGKDGLWWYMTQLKGYDMVLHKHWMRSTVAQEVKHIEDKLAQKSTYIVKRYNNGLHRQQYEIMKGDKGWSDTVLYASTVFMYRNTRKVQDMLKDWWYYQSRYFTCDQVVLPYVLYKHTIKVREIEKGPYDAGYISLVSSHK
jgi:hypothetical protein